MAFPEPILRGDFNGTRVYLQTLQGESPVEAIFTTSEGGFEAVKSARAATERLTEIFRGPKPEAA